MKLLVSMLFMGIVGNSAAFHSSAVRYSRRIRRELFVGNRGTVTALKVPTLIPRVSHAPPVEEGEISTLLLASLLEAQSGAGRFRLRSRVLAQRLRSRWIAQGPAVIKRSVDILGSLALLVALSPVLAFIALLVKLEDGGPILFAQTRVGRHGTEFKMFKIRSMCMDAEKRLQEVLARNHHREGITFKLKDDPRVTKIGKWLRKFSLDELPQFFNVLAGSMSLVGPRPPLPREVAKYSLADRRRLGIKPGITCTWQVSGRSEIDFSRQVQLDVDYIEQRGFLTDLRLLWLTPVVVLSGKGAC